MRELLFHGKQIENNEWVEGALISIQTDLNGNDNQAFIVSEINFRDSIYDVWKYADEVNPETVGQFTGKVDKNGTKIFEGDVFQLDDDIVAVVIFSDGCFRLEEYGLCGTWTESGYDECGGGYGIVECEPIDWYFLKDMEIIGNIHDNPALIPC